MTAKEYLSRYRLINVRINMKIDQQRQLRELATNISPSSSNGGHSSSVSDKVGTAVAKIATLEQEIDAEIDMLVKAKAEIERTIADISDERLRLILFARYINCMRWEQIAVTQSIELRWLYRLHGRALREVEKIIDH